MKIKKFIYISLLSVLICCGKIENTSSNKNSDLNQRKYGTLAENAMVVSARKEASQIGLDILKKGGNAFDAMMATEMALAVCYPFAGNLGGGGFMVYRLANGDTGALDYREKAPLAASKDMYLDQNGDVVPNKSTEGSLAIGVPGTVAGIFKAQEKFGKLSVKEILTPVIELANQGFVVTEKQQKRFEYLKETFIKINKDTIKFARKIAIGDTLKNKQLANTLTRIAENGRDEFYKGKTAEILIDFLKRKEAIITAEDLRRYEAQWRNPIIFSYKDLNIISMSPPSSGGVCLAQIFKMIEPYPIEEYGHNSVKSIQLITEAERRAYADRSYYLGDPDFVEIPLDTLLSQKYLKKRMQSFSFEKATSSSSISHGQIKGYESEETTHYSIVDSYGNAIAVTTTLNGAYGSKLYCKELGIFLNNEMDDFSAKPGTPNMFGLIGAEANAIAPEKRMLSSMTPTIVEKDDQLWMSVGTPGGSTIITSVLQTILNVKEYNMTMQEAVDAPRFHHQWLPDKITFEPDVFDKNVLDSLRKKEYTIDEKTSRIIGKVDGILVRPDQSLEGGADRRGDDAAVGF